MIFRQLRFLFCLQEGYTGIKVPIVVRDLGFLHLVSILFPSANTDFVSIIISHTRHIFQPANTAAPQIFRIAAVIF